MARLAIASSALGSALSDSVEFASLGNAIASRIRGRTAERLDEFASVEAPPRNGYARPTLAIHRHAAQSAAEILYPKRYNLFTEGYTGPYDTCAPLSFYLVPIDGALNSDRRASEPAFAIACCSGPAAARLADLDAAYVEGLVTGDRYWAQDGKAFFRAGPTGRTMPLSYQGPQRLADSVGYLRFAETGAAKPPVAALSRFRGVCGMRAADGAAMKFCEIARGTADFMISPHGIANGYDLLAWPVVRAIGGDLCTLAGHSLPEEPFNLDAVYHYIVASSANLCREVVAAYGAYP